LPEFALGHKVPGCLVYIIEKPPRCLSPAGSVALCYLEAAILELRSSPRRAVTLYTMLDYHSLGLVRGCIRDIGLGGMFVDIGRIQLPVNATLRASLMIGPSDLRQPVHVDAVVVRCAEQGVGLMFDELNSEMRHTLDRLIRGGIDPAREGDCPDFLH